MHSNRCLTSERPGPKPNRKEREHAAEIEKIFEILRKWGIHSLGQLAALEKDKLVARLGPVALRLWECAQGKSVRLLKLVQPAESFCESFEFENEIETVEPLLFMLRRFLDQFSQRLGAFHLVAKEITLRFTFSNQRHYEYCFKIPEPTRSVAALFRMLHAHLENFHSEFPIVAVSLAAKSAHTVSQQVGLFETALRDPAQLSETLAQLTGLLGSDRVGTPVLENTHRPDAFHLEPFTWQLTGTSSAPKPLPAFALRRFRSPRSAAVMLAEEKPIHLRSNAIHDVVQEANGPYHSSGNWWNAQDWRRAEWDLQLQPGLLCRCHREGESWRLDGVYD